MDFEKNILTSAIYQSKTNGSPKIYNELMCVSRQLLDQEMEHKSLIDEFKCNDALSAETIAFYQTVKYGLNG